MTTPKQALEIARGYIVDDIKRKPFEYNPADDLRKIDEALASLQGEDAVERVNALARRFWSIHPSTIAAMNLTREEFYAREMMALLATGLVPDEAAVPDATDAMIKAAHDAKIFLNMTDEGWRKAWRVMYAAAIRSGGAK